MTDATTSEGIVPSKPERLHGRYTVQICDADTGKVKRRYNADNYVTPMHYAQAQVLQVQAAYGGYIPTGTGTQGVEAIAGRGYVVDVTASPGVIPMHLICSDWSEAEDVTESWAKGRVVAYAPRHKVTALSTGRKGLINETESGVSTDGRVMTLVWDWSTTQGNGTFQSIMFGNIGVQSDVNAAIMTTCGESGRFIYGVDGVISPRQSTKFVTDGTTLYALLCSATTPFVGWKNVTTDWGGGASVPDNSGQWRAMPGVSSGGAWSTWTKPATTFLIDNTGGSAQSNVGSAGWDACHDGTNMYFVNVGNAATVLNIRAFVLATGANVYNNVATGYTAADWGAVASYNLAGITHVAGKLYVIYMDDQATALADRQRIARFNAATGAFEAFIDLTGVLTATEYLTGSITDDGTDLIVETTQGIMKLTTAGAYVANSHIGAVRVPPAFTSSSPVGMTGSAGSNYFMENGVAPDSVANRHMFGPQRLGGSQIFPSRRGPVVKTESFYLIDPVSNRYMVDSFTSWVDIPFQNADTTGNIGSLGPLTHRMLWHDSRLWIVTQGLSIADGVNGAGWDGVMQGTLVASVDGLNMFSRAVLDTPVTKSATETMKITYQLTMPVDPWKIQPSVNPWA